MSRSLILRAVAKRAPWLAVGLPILKAAGFETTRGQQPTIDAALQSARDAVLDGKLGALMEEHAVAGEKLVRLIEVNAAERARIAAWIQAKRRHANDLSDAFPGIAPDAQLPQFTATSPTSLGMLQLSHATAAAFTAVRSYQDRVEISVNQLVAGANDGYERLYATKLAHWQTFDSVCLIPGLNYVVLATDLPQKVPSGFAKASQQYLEAQVRIVLGRPVHSVNLWKAVAGLYKAHEGRLVDHGFVNNSDAVKQHTARRGGGNLRDDPYDVAGAAAVGNDLLTFRGAISWEDRKPDGGIVSKPELILPGTARHLGNGVLDHFIIRNSINSRDLEFVTSKVLAHI
jgi:hypothetical protein